MIPRPTSAVQSSRGSGRLRCIWAGFVAVLVLFPAASALACIWDYDTLKQEAARFPGTLELLAGKFNRHSPAFYAWRIDDRLAKLEARPEALPLMDDLAVAYDKVGRTAEGVAVLREALELAPARYETHANLGTLLVHSGDYEAGLTHLRRAIEINPEAHFGRERWQIYLVEHVVANLGEDGQPRLPLGDFSSFLAGKELDDGWHEQAIRGVEGMMRFGHHDSAVLNQALGDLLSRGKPLAKEQRLAARAYLKAAQNVVDHSAVQPYRDNAAEALRTQREGRFVKSDVTLREVEADFAHETSAGDAWFEQIASDEKAWIAAGLNPEVEFDRKYATPE